MSSTGQLLKNLFKSPWSPPGRTRHKCHSVLLVEIIQGLISKVAHICFLLVLKWETVVSCWYKHHISNMKHVLKKWAQVPQNFIFYKTWTHTHERERQTNTQKKNIWIKRPVFIRFLVFLFYFTWTYTIVQFSVHHLSELHPSNNSCSLTIKAAILCYMIQEPGMGVKGWSEYKHPRVEAVRPGWIRGRWQLLPIKQLIHVTQNLTQ